MGIQAELKPETASPVLIQEVAEKFNLPPLNLKKTVFWSTQIGADAIGLFDNEFEKDIYFYDQKRKTINRVRAEENYQEEYETNETDHGLKYLVPVHSTEVLVSADNVFKTMNGGSVAETTTQRPRAIKIEKQEQDAKLRPTRVQKALKQDGFIHPAAQDESDDIDVERDDVPMSAMTLRRYACIKLGVPESGLPWLDSLIRKSQVK